MLRVFQNVLDESDGSHRLQPILEALARFSYSRLEVRQIEFASLRLSSEKSSSARCHDSVGGWNCDADAPLSGTNQP